MIGNRFDEESVPFLPEFLFCPMQSPGNIQVKQRTCKKPVRYRSAQYYLLVSARFLSYNC